MFNRRSAWVKQFALSLLTAAALAAPARAQIGALLTGAGPVNRSMGGASVGAPIDASGALFWNPASISGLAGSSMDLGVELILPQTRLSSSVPAGGFGIPLPAMAGSDRGDNGIFPMPTMALVYRPEGSDWTFGLGVFSVGGFGVNYPASAFLTPTTNPILSPQLPNGVGLGSVYTNLQVMELIPTASFQISNRLSIGAGPTLTMANLRADPFFLATPNADASYPPGSHSRVAWGAGFQVGAYYRLDNGLQIGTSVKSPQWMEDFRFQSQDQKGTPRTLTTHFDLPMIISLGFGYTGIERLTLATDFRFVNFHSTRGFRDTGYDATGAVRGLGWRNVFAAATGAQYQLTDNFSFRVGYSYNQNPIADNSDAAFFNIGSPTIIEHTLYLGASMRVSDALSLSIGYAHAFQNSVASPYLIPGFGAIPASSVRSTASADTWMMGATVRFGAR